MAPIDFSKFLRDTADSSSALLDPRDIFNALPGRNTSLGYLRGPQDQVLEQWFQRRNDRDVVIKMNTGGGKTIVGLLIAQSSINEKIGPVAYLVPDHYLALQVRDEAARLGIEITDDPRSHAFASGRAILVDTFQRLFNGMSVFGVSSSAGRAPVAQLGTVVIDDAHACVTKAEQVFRITVPSSEAEYGKILNLFEDAISEQSPSTLMDLKASGPTALQQIPHWAWSDRQDKVVSILHPVSTRDGMKFSWPLLVDSLPICRAVMTSDKLEISAPCPPVDTLTGFQNARRRIYLTATLADDGVLVTDFGADPDSVSAPIVPANAGDIGDRLILIPEQTHPRASQDEIKELVVGLALNRNVVVIVPSRARAEFWKADAKLTLDKDNLVSGISELRSNSRVGLVVLINRYDGVDLPGSTCHVLVIDGLPEALDAMERLDQSELSGSDTLLRRQVQRLEQGMGRATRSNEDHCVVILLGARLAERLYGTVARRSFSAATRAQLDLSERVADEVVGKPLTELRGVIDQCLQRDKSWVAASRGVLAALRYEPATVTKSARAMRLASNFAESREFRAAVTSLQEAVDLESSPIMKGYLLQQLSAYQHQYDPAAAQQTQLAANRLNRNLLRPMRGITYEKLNSSARGQAVTASSWLQTRYATGTDLVVGFNALLADLDWGLQTNAFEEAWMDVAYHLGFVGQRPERDTGKGPDVLWAIDSPSFLVCELKSGVTSSHPVYKKDAEQLSNSMDWFRSQYPASQGLPLLVHPSSTFDSKAAIPTGCRVVTEAMLSELRSNLSRLSVGLADSDSFRDAARTNALFDSLGLNSPNFLSKYSVAARSAR